MDNFLNKLPNWLRYIVAIPIGIISLVVFYYIGYFSNLYIASPDSIYIKIYNFLYNNGINVIIMISVMNYVLPKYQFQFTLILSILFCGIAFTGLGMNILMQNITTFYIIGFLLTIISFIFCCYYTYKEYTMNKIDKYVELSNIVMKGLDISNINEAITIVYKFYKEQNINLDSIKIEDENKFKVLSEIVMLGTETKDIDEAIKNTTEFYTNKQENLINN